MMVPPVSVDYNSSPCRLSHPYSLSHSSTISQATLCIVSVITTHATLVADSDSVPFEIEAAAVHAVVGRIFTAGAGTVSARLSLIAALCEDGVGCEDHGDEEAGGESHGVEK
jgi:hypothetical protein